MRLKSQINYSLRSLFGIHGYGQISDDVAEWKAQTLRYSGAARRMNVQLLFYLPEKLPLTRSFRTLEFLKGTHSSSRATDGSGYTPGTLLSMRAKSALNDLIRGFLWRKDNVTDRGNTRSCSSPIRFKSFLNQQVVLKRTC